MDSLNDVFNRLLTPEQKAEIEKSYERDLDTGNTNLRAIPPDPLANSKLHTDISRLDTSESDPSALSELFLKSVRGESKPRFPPPKVLPCANVEAVKYRACPNPGNKACSSCRLVSYCSKECQSANWRVHKSDCKSRLRSEEWKPAWVTEDREPMFIGNMTPQEDFEEKRKDKLSMGLSLWGNTPAIDLVNLSENEKDTKSDLSLAFIASGDLRHVLHTVNTLPADYKGKLRILLNDRTPHVVVRNTVLLLLLGNVPDEATAVESALHFWYSAFMPGEYQLLISSEIISLIKQADNDGIARSQLGMSSTLSCILTPEPVELVRQLVSQDLSMGQAQEGYDRVRTAPSRRDYRDRMYAGLKPSHRVAFQEYRRFGIVLPFGAMNSHFNVPNRSLFTPTGTWLQTDYADPLEGWDIDKVFEIGQSHGAQPEDVYGCLYFFLSDQLREFAKRIRRLNISFHCSGFDALILAQGIKDGTLSDHGIPASVRFDRIEVSNILDVNYVGIEGVLNEWAPLLKNSRTAVIVGYFMNWIAMQADGQALSAGPKVMKQLIGRLMEEGRSPLANLSKQNGNVFRSSDIETMIFLAASSMDALYDNSKPFDTFLRKQGMDRILSKTKLKLRGRHTIVPHRNKAPLHGSSNAVPDFADNESWYRHVNILSTSFSERYIELVNR